MKKRKIDWSKAPEGATHYNIITGAFYRINNGSVELFSLADQWAKSTFQKHEVTGDGEMYGFFEKQEGDA